MRKYKRMMQKFQQRMQWVRQYAWRLMPIGIGLVVLIVVYTLLFSSLFSVRTISIAHSDPRLDTTLIQRALKPLFNRHLLFVSSLEIPPLLSAQLPKIARSAVPDLQDVSVKKSYPSQLKVQITLKPIAYRLQIEEPGQTTTPQTASGSDYLTTDGMYVRYDNKQVQSGASLPLLRIVDWGERPNPWQPLLSSEMLAAIDRSETAVKTDFGIPIRGRVVYLRAREFHLQTDRVALWFDLKSSIPEQLQRLKIYRQIAPGAAREYVDLRLKDKVVYR